MGQGSALGRFGSWLAAAAIVVALAAPARASLETDILERWYALLGTANASGLGSLLAPRARIKLDDLGVTQTKAEFLESMDEWREAISGGTIRYHVQTTSAGAATAVVCYQFKENELLTREVFRIVNGLITASEQSKVAESCKTFGD